MYPIRFVSKYNKSFADGTWKSLTPIRAASGFVEFEQKKYWNPRLLNAVRPNHKRTLIPAEKKDDKTHSPPASRKFHRMGTRNISFPALAQ